MRYCNFEALTDEEIVLEAKDNDNEDALVYLINKYRNFVRAKARSYFLIGAEREDIIQEGMIGLYKAIRDFRNDKLSSFRVHGSFPELLRVHFAEAFISLDAYPFFAFVHYVP